MWASPKFLSMDEFLAWGERRELRCDFDGVFAEPMTGGAPAHAHIQGNLMGACCTRLRGGPCFVLGSKLNIRENSFIRYPDARGLCSPLHGVSNWTGDRTVIFEILSPSSAREDLGVKNAERQTLASLQRYVVLHQDAVAAEVFFRDEEGEFAHEFIAAGGVLRMSEISVETPLPSTMEASRPDRAELVFRQSNKRAKLTRDPFLPSPAP
jgi:Uma2 family endonuclease